MHEHSRGNWEVILFRGCGQKWGEISTTVHFSNVHHSQPRLQHPYFPRLLCTSQQHQRFANPDSLCKPSYLTFSGLKTVFWGQTPQRQKYIYARKVIILRVFYAHRVIREQSIKLACLLKLNAVIIMLFSKTPHKLIKI